MYLHISRTSCNFSGYSNAYLKHIIQTSYQIGTFPEMCFLWIFVKYLYFFRQIKHKLNNIVYALKMILQEMGFGGNFWKHNVDISRDIWMLKLFPGNSHTKSYLISEWQTLSPCLLVPSSSAPCSISRSNIPLLHVTAAILSGSSAIITVLVNTPPTARRLSSAGLRALCSFVDIFDRRVFATQMFPFVTAMCKTVWPAYSVLSRSWYNNFGKLSSKICKTSFSAAEVNCMRLMAVCKTVSPFLLPSLACL